MTTFSYAYGPELQPHLEGRKVYLATKRAMEALDGKAFDVANGLIRRKYADDPTTRNLAMMLLTAQRPFETSLLQQSSNPQQQPYLSPWCGQGGLFGGIFGSGL